MQIKITLNSGNEQLLFFSSAIKKSVIAKYNQLVSQGDIQGFTVL